MAKYHPETGVIPLGRMGTPEEVAARLSFSPPKMQPMSPVFCSLSMADSWPSTWSKAVSQLVWSRKGREEWFSLRENHERRRGFDLHQSRTALEKRLDYIDRSLDRERPSLGQTYWH